MAISKGRPRVWRETDGLSALPRSWSLYRITENTGEIFYIGITSNLYSRISQHRSKGRFESGRHHLQYQLATAGTTWDDLMLWEKRKIQQHQPAGVTYLGGNGRRPLVEVNGIAIEVEEGESVEDAIERRGLLDRFMSLFR